MYTRNLPLGEKGEIVFIRRSEISSNILTVMVLDKCFLYLTKEGEMELIDPRWKKYHMEDFSQPPRIRLVTIDKWEQHVERRNFENKLFELAQRSEGAKQRAAVGFIHIRQAYTRIREEPSYEEKPIETELMTVDETTHQRPRYSRSTMRALYGDNRQSGTEEMIN